MSLLDMLGGVLSPQALDTAAQSVSSQVGTTPEQTQHAMEASVPLILSALTRNAQTPDGEAALSSALAQHDGSALDGLGLGQLPDQQQGQAILGHVFGSQAPAAANAVAQRSGIDPGMAMQILSMVAPLVMGMLGRGQAGGMGGLGGGLGSVLGGLLGGGQAQGGGMGGGLGGMLGSILGGGQGQGGGMGGGLGGMLGSILGGGQAQPQVTQYQEQQAPTGGLGGMLGSILGGGQPQPSQQSQQQGGGLGSVMGTLGNVLGGGGNGNALDELVSMFGGNRR